MTRRSGAGDQFGALLDLIAVLDAARAGHDDHGIAADFERHLILTMVPPGRKLRLASL